jgi:hypothetical protein
MTKLIAFSISKSSIILEYSKDGKELIAIIEPYLFATYLVDLGVISDRVIDSDGNIASWIPGRMDHIQNVCFRFSNGWYLYSCTIGWYFRKT